MHVFSSVSQQGPKTCVPFLLIRVFECARLIFFMLMRMTLFLTEQYSHQPRKSR